MSPVDKRALLYTVMEICLAVFVPEAAILAVFNIINIFSRSEQTTSYTTELWLAAIVTIQSC